MSTPSSPVSGLPKTPRIGIDSAIQSGRNSPAVDDSIASRVKARRTNTDIVRTATSKAQELVQAVTTTLYKNNLKDQPSGYLGEPEWPKKSTNLIKHAETQTDFSEVDSKNKSSLLKRVGIVAVVALAVIGTYMYATGSTTASLEEMKHSCSQAKATLENSLKNCQEGLTGCQASNTDKFKNGYTLGRDHGDQICQDMFVVTDEVATCTINQQTTKLADYYPKLKADSTSAFEDYLKAGK
jgi:hypothetical protein